MINVSEVVLFNFNLSIESLARLFTTIRSFISRMFTRLFQMGTIDSGPSNQLHIMHQQAQAAKFQERRLSDHVYELLPEPHPDVELVFFHGLQMQGSPPEHSFWRTWKMRSSENCWPETLLPAMLNPEVKARVLSVSYEARPNLGEDRLGTERSDEYLIVECLMQEVVLDKGVNVGQKKGVPIFLVGHDLGGILIKEFVMKLESQGAVRSDENGAKIRSFLENLKSVFFYATPHSGSPAIEKIAAKIDENDANLMLRFMKVLNTDAGRINYEFQQYRQEKIGAKMNRFTSHAMHASYLTNEGGFHQVLVVPEGSARNDVDTFYTVSANHFSVCQPEGKHSTPLIYLSDEIKKEVKKAKEEQMKELRRYNGRKQI